MEAQETTRMATLVPPPPRYDQRRQPVWHFPPVVLFAYLLRLIWPRASRAFVIRQTFTYFVTHLQKQRIGWSGWSGVRRHRRHYQASQFRIFIIKLQQPRWDELPNETDRVPRRFDIRRSAVRNCPSTEHQSALVLCLQNPKPTGVPGESERQQGSHHCGLFCNVMITERDFAFIISFWCVFALFQMVRPVPNVDTANWIDYRWAERKGPSGKGQSRWMLLLSQEVIHSEPSPF